ncbi:TIP49 C-terminus-domain-containing protein [Infundibulicybe gibba]|nr:TIP49 C-terminus-domain-containing protein [Infundibulicybe gibba]
MKIAVEDVIYIEANTGAVKVCRSDACASAYDLRSETRASPKRRRARAKGAGAGYYSRGSGRGERATAGGQGVMSIMGSLVKSGCTEKLRREMNKVVQGYADQSVSEVVPGVAFIDEVHIDCFTYLNAPFESPVAPIVIFTTNRGNALVRGITNIVPYTGSLSTCSSGESVRASWSASHRSPYPRCRIIKTDSYTRERASKVVYLWATTEDIDLGLGALEGEKSCAGPRDVPGAHAG